jgi:hypothetical protein
VGNKPFLLPTQNERALMQQIEQLQHRMQMEIGLLSSALGYCLMRLPSRAIMLTQENEPKGSINVQKHEIGFTFTFIPQIPNDAEAEKDVH